MEQLLSFFSSDAGDLYKADVFRTLALPEGYVIRFRYREKYIHSALKGEYDRLKGKKGCILFLAGNASQQVEASARPLQFFSIREVEVEHVYLDKENTDRVYFYLKLGKFVNFELVTADATYLPTNDIYVSTISVKRALDGHRWIDRIQAISNYFPEHLFFRIDSIKKNGVALTPKFNSNEASSSFELDDESEFQCEMQFFDNGSGKSVLLTNTLFEAVKVEIPQKFIVGALTDRLIFGIQTNSLARKRESATIRFCQEEKSSAYSVDLGIRAVRNAWKPVSFGLFTALAALGLVLGQMTTKLPAEMPQLVSRNGVLGLAAVIAIGVSASFLFSMFNKR